VLLLQKVSVMLQTIAVDSGRLCAAAGAAANVFGAAADSVVLLQTTVVL